MLHRRHDKLITILVPCRSRHERTLSLLRSIEKNTDDTSRVRVITITDFDQTEDHNNIARLVNSGEITYELLNITRTRDVQLNRNYYNLANLMGESYFCWILGNDIEVETDGWDTILYEAVKDSLTLIQSDEQNYYILIDDDTHTSNGKYEEYGSCFPIISNNYCEKIRGPMPEYKNAWGGDIELYKNCRSDVENWEFIHLENDIKISHYCIHNGKAVADEVNINVKNNEN